MGRLQICKRSAEHISEDTGLQACRIGTDQEKQRLLAKKRDTFSDQRENRLFHFPDFALRSPAVGGRIHDNGVIMVSAPYFPVDETHAVIDEPSNGTILETGRADIFVGPADHALRRIHMGYGSAGFQCGAGGPACIGEQV